MKKISSLLLLFSLVFDVSAALLYSVETSSDQLVQIDSISGSVTTIGALGFDAKDTDLVTQGVDLFLLNSDFGVEVDLHNINTITGASTSAIQVKNNGVGVKNAEGLTQIGGQLKIGFSTPGSTFSNTFGNVALNGAISNSSSGGFDLDGLAYNSSNGKIYGVDVMPGDRTDLYILNESSTSLSVFKSILPTVFINDIEVQGNALFGIDHLDNKLYTLDLTTNDLSSVDIGGNGSYLGLAVVSAVPVPPSIFLLLTGMLTFIGFRKK